MMWKPGAAVLGELVWDGRSRVAEEEEGHQGHGPSGPSTSAASPQRMSVGDLHAHSFHRAAPGHDHELEGAVEHGLDLDVVRAVRVMLGWQVLEHRVVLPIRIL